MYKKKILIVEDEGIIAEDLKQTLTRLGYEVTGIASSSQKALEMAEANIPHLAVMDVMLRGKTDGITTAMRLNDRFEIPSIYLTAYADKKLMEKAKTSAPYSYIIKPFDERELYTNVEIAIERSIANRKMQRMNVVLKTIRDINQLIVQEKDSQKMIRQACKILTGKNGYPRAWIVLLDNNGQLTDSAQKGWGKHFQLLLKMLKKGYIPACGQKALNNNETILTDKTGNCRNCPFQGVYPEYNNLTIALKYHDTTFGLLSVALPDRTEVDESEMDLFQEVAGDISFSLHDIALEFEQKQTYKVLQEREQQLSQIYESVGNVIFYIKVEQDNCFRFLSVNHVFLDATGLAKDEIIGKRIDDVIPEPSLTLARDNYKKAIEQKRIIRWEETTAYPRGIKVGEVSIAPIFDKGICTFLVGSVYDITEIKKVEMKLNHRAELEMLIANVSSNLAKNPVEEIDNTINKALAEIGVFSEVDRAYVFRLLNNGTTMTNSHEWCAGGIEPQIENLKNLPVSIFPWWMDKLNHFENIHIPKVANLSKEASAEKEILESQNIQSLLVVPMIVQNKLSGFIGFDSVESEKKWLDEDITLLRIMGETIAVSLEQSESLLALRDSESSFRGIYDNATDAIYIQDKKGRFLDVNQGAIDMYGYPREYYIGNNPGHLTAPGKNDMKKIGHYFEKAIEGVPQQFEFWGKRKNGEVFPQMLRLNKSKYFSKDVIIAFAQDITKRKMTDNALTTLATRYAGLSGKSFYESVSKLIAENMNLDYVYVGELIPNMESINVLGGYTNGDVMEKLVYKLENMPCENVIEKKLLIYQENVQSLFPQAELLSEMNVEGYIGKLLFTEDGDPLGILVGMSTSPIVEGETLRNYFDIFIGRLTSELLRKKAETELIVSEKRLVESQRVAKIGHYLLNTVTGRWVCSAEVYQIFGIDKTYTKDITGWVGLIHPADRSEIENYLQSEILANEKTFNKQYRIITPQGSIEKWIHHLGKLKCDDKNNVIEMFGTIQDITELKQAEEEKAKLEDQLRHAQKLESISRLTGGIAHDFNNLLGAIFGSVDMIMMELPKDHPSRRFAKIILDKSQKAANLVKQMMAYSRQQHLIMESLVINNALMDLSMLLDRALEERITLVMDLADDLEPINCDRSAIDQIVMNLCLNATDAMKDGGTLTVRTMNLENVDNYSRKQPDIIPDRYVLLSVSDTGHGIESEYFDNIFDPFFTTKQVGEGTGLGLSMVYGLVKQHGGYIFYQSEVDSGTTFEVLFPVIDKQQVPIVKKSTKDHFHYGGGTIMVVEDEESLLAVIEVMLTELGYNIITAIDGESALQLYRDAGKQIDLVISDVIMPNMGGKELYLEIVKINPDVKFVFTSGYASQGFYKKYDIDPGMKILNKPFRLKDVSDIVREALS